jgi:hypothetical protein
MESNEITQPSYNQNKTNWSSIDNNKHAQLMHNSSKATHIVIIGWFHILIGDDFVEGITVFR